MEAMATFVPGSALNADFYAEAVAPLLAPWPHAAARLGAGSDVLGFDTARSTDHGWGPALTVFVDSGDLDAVRAAVDAGLPAEFRGWPVRYGWDEVAVAHHVEVTTLPGWLVDQLGVDASAGLSGTDWLLMPQQRLLEVTAGAVYHDDPGDLTRARAALAWYPDDVWRWLLAAQWRRVAEEEAFVGRAAEVGDELGARLVTARLARELMRVWFLLCRTYWPYSKWFGTAFARLPGSLPLVELLEHALSAGDHRTREAALLAAAERVAVRHNDAGLTAPVDPHPRPFFSRPWHVLGADRLVDACLDSLGGSWLRGLPLIGSVDQVADSTDLLSDGRRPRRLAALYEP